MFPHRRWNLVPFGMRLSGASGFYFQCGGRGARRNASNTKVRFIKVCRVVWEMLEFGAATTGRSSGQSWTSCSRLWSRAANSSEHSEFWCSLRYYYKLPWPSQESTKWFQNTNIVFLDVIQPPVSIWNTQRFGDWILSPSSGESLLSWVSSIDLVPTYGHHHQHKIGYLNQAQNKASLRVKTKMKNKFIEN
jgi:hypothetical protein